MGGEIVNSSSGRLGGEWERHFNVCKERRWRRGVRGAQLRGHPTPLSHRPMLGVGQCGALSRPVLGQMGLWRGDKRAEGGLAGHRPLRRNRSGHTGQPWVQQTLVGRGGATVPRCPAASSSQPSPQPRVLGPGAAGPVWARSPPGHHPGPPSHRILLQGY